MVVGAHADLSSKWQYDDMAYMYMYPGDLNETRRDVSGKLIFNFDYGAAFYQRVTENKYDMAQRCGCCCAVMLGGDGVGAFMRNAGKHDQRFAKINGAASIIEVGYRRRLAAAALGVFKQRYEERALGAAPFMMHIVLPERIWNDEAALIHDMWMYWAEQFSGEERNYVTFHIGVDANALAVDLAEHFM